jgi:hypothetical protein
MFALRKNHCLQLIQTETQDSQRAIEPGRDRLILTTRSKSTKYSAILSHKVGMILEGIDRTKIKQTESEFEELDNYLVLSEQSK